MLDVIPRQFWMLPELTQINRLPAHGAGIPLADVEAAFGADLETSPWRLSLDGQWRFQLYHRVEDVPEAVFAPGFDDGEWRTIDVPSNWTMRDTFDKPHYTNIKMPFHNDPPVVPDANPTGVYRRSFTLPENWRGRRVVLHVGAAESCLEVWLNGKFVGMGKDCRLPSEFELTPFLTDGENALACRVIRWSDGTYIEDQDQWWMAGIYRSVWLCSTAPVFIKDLFVNGDWEVKTGTGKLKIEVELGMGMYNFFGNLDNDMPNQPGPDPTGNFTVRAQLRGADGREFLALEGKISASFRHSNYRVVLEGDVPNAAPWSAEHPNLYKLAVELTGLDGSRLDVRGKRVGFRNIRISRGNLLFNGVRVHIKGVNRHEHDMRNGKTLTRDEMLRDIIMMKQYNFNAVRTCHYPDDHRWYDLCDEYGIYILDEMNFEAHRNYSMICRDSRWRDAIVERGTRMVRRDRSHACIYCWSLGNESGNGENHTAVAEAILKLDSTRCIHNQGELAIDWMPHADSGEGGFDWLNNFYDPMYLSIAGLLSYSRNPRSKRPAILCEYAHAMGNSSGSLSDYWELFYSKPKLQGGFIWDWIDQGLCARTPDGVEYLAYGGDFGDTPNDTSFCCNGMLAADTSPHPAMMEFRHLVQPVKVTLKKLRHFRFTVLNRQYFTSLALFAGSWKLLLNGEEVQSGSLDMQPVAPWKSFEVKLPVKKFKIAPGDEVMVNFEFVTAKNLPWAPAGTLLAHDQIDLTSAFDVNKAAAAVEPAIAAMTENDVCVTLSTGNATVTIDKKTGTGTLHKNSELVLEKLFDCNLFRANTENDCVRGWNGQSAKPGWQWLNAGLNALTVKHAMVKTGNNAVIIQKTLIGTDPAAEVIFTQAITVEATGVFHFEQTYLIPESFPELPRVGVAAWSVPGFEKVRYYGRGPWENYIDRNSSAMVGSYKDTVDGMYEDSYIVPQENGNRTEVRNFTLSSADTSLRISGDVPFEFGVSHSTPADLIALRHQYERRPRPETIISIDLAQRGLGTGSCGPQTLPRYCLTDKHYCFGFDLAVK